MGRAARPKRHPRSWDGSSLELVESRLHPPPARPGIVRRALLVERLLASDTVPVVCVVAPAGYGKTTLLARQGHGLGLWRPGVGDVPAHLYRARQLPVLLHAAPGHERPGRRRAGGHTMTPADPG